MIDKAYEIIDDLNDDKIIKDIEKIKYKIKNDPEIKKILKDFNIAKDNYEKYNIKDEFINAKKKLLENDVLKDYINIQNKINMLSLKINKKINDLTKNITCNK